MVADDPGGHDLLGNTYNIYQQEIPELDMYMHLLKWIYLLKSCLSRKLEPDDYIITRFQYFALPCQIWA